MGRSERVGIRDQLKVLVQHFFAVNRSTREYFASHRTAAFQIWSEQSLHDWTYDFGEYRNRVAEYIDYAWRTLDRSNDPRRSLTSSGVTIFQGIVTALRTRRRLRTARAGLSVPLLGERLLLCFVSSISMHTTRHTMNTERTRAHIVIPESLLEDVDALVGPRRRSEFCEEAAREKVRQEKLRRAAHKLASSLAGTPIPGWENSAEARKWVRSLRRESDERSLGAEKK
jgi:hypothetical protein